MADDGATIVIKKIKKGGHGHHGGAWKVAYADFVTAMMAFFLLLWLLSSTSESQKEGIAEYFTPTIGLRDEAGIGFEGGTSPSEEGKKKGEMSPPGLVMGATQTGQLPEAPKPALQEQDADSQLFDHAEAEMKQAIESDPNLREITENILMEQTPEGLKIDIIDNGKEPMFQPGGAEITEFGKAILWKLSDVIIRMPNHISITGHTDASGFAPDAPYTNWELSSDRANSARRFLNTTKMEKDRVAKIVGRADKEPLPEHDSSSPRNRRITIILLRGSHLDQQPQDQVAPRGLLSTPRPVDPEQAAQERKEREARRQERERKRLLEEQKKNADSPFKEQGLPELPPEQRPGMESPGASGDTPSFEIQKGTAPGRPGGNGGTRPSAAPEKRRAAPPSKPPAAAPKPVGTRPVDALDMGR